MTHLYLKAVHLIFIVTWFSGLFYIPRLFVYLIETAERPEPEKTILRVQLKMMASRLWYGITWPSAIITLAMGTSLIINNPAWLQQSFMHIKLTLVALLYAYHFSLHVVFRQLQKDVIKYSSTQMRLWNEVATLFLISIVFLIVLKSTLSMTWGIVGLIVVAGAIMAGIRIYKNLRKR
jgi:protoporphyrinogen IX oxidase